MKRVKMLQTCEDTNATPVKDERGKYSLKYTTDRLTGGEEYDLPDEQAENLMRLKYAVPVAADKPAPAPKA